MADQDDVLQLIEDEARPHPVSAARKWKVAVIDDDAAVHEGTRFALSDYVLNGQTLAGAETFYLGHRSGAIFVPPVSVLDHVLVPESPGDDATLIHVLAPDAKSKRLVEIGRIGSLAVNDSTKLA